MPIELATNNLHQTLGLLSGANTRTPFENAIGSVQELVSTSADDQNHDHNYSTANDDNNAREGQLIVNGDGIKSVRNATETLILSSTEQAQVYYSLSITTRAKRCSR